MKVIGKDRTSCDVCNPIDEILARLDALERRASAIVAKVQGIAPDGDGNVTLPTSSSDTDPLHGRIDAFAMSSEVKEAADDAHAYAASIADDVVTLQSDVENLTREVEALDPSSMTALEQSVAALQQTVNQLSNVVGGFSAVIRDLEDQMPNKVDRTGDTMTGPLNVIDTVTGSRNLQAVNGNRLQNDLDNYSPMVRTTGNVQKFGKMEMMNGLIGYVGDWRHASTNKPMTVGQWCIFAEISNFSTGAYRIIEFIQGSNTASCYGKMIFNSEPNSPDAVWLIIKGRGGNNPLTYDSIKILTDGTKIYLAWQKKYNYGTLRARQYASVEYGNAPVYNQDITWLPREEMPILDNLDNYTVFDVIQ